MSQEVSKRLGSVGYNPDISHLYVGEITHLQTIDPTLPETNSSPMKVTIFPSKYHQNGGFSMTMLVYRSVTSNGTPKYPQIPRPATKRAAVSCSEVDTHGFIAHNDQVRQ